MANTVTKTLSGIGTLSVAIPAGVTSVQVISRSKRLALAPGESNTILDATGTAYAFGYNAIGQLGVGDLLSRSSPVAVLGGLTFASINGSALGNNAQFGITTTGLAYAWGENGQARLGVGDQVARSSPVAVLGGLRFQKITSHGNQFSVGLTLGGQLYAWGQNSAGWLGTGDVTPRSSPVIVLGGLTFSDFAAAYPSNSGTQAFVLGLTTAGAMYAWGSNGTYQLGVGSQTAAFSSPILVLGGLTWKQAIIGQNNTQMSGYGLTTAGAAYAWGYNSDGQLGIGDVASRSSPVAVLGGLTFTKLISTSASTAFMFGLTAAGALYAWGANANGQLGVGDVASRSSPVAVLGGLVFQKVAGNMVGNTASIVALSTAGLAYAWGVNSFGQLGVGDVLPRSSPVAVLGGLTFVDIACYVCNNSNTNSFYGLASTGQVYAWGDNNQGQLGVGDQLPRSSPVAVLGGIFANTVDVFTTVNLTVTPGTSYTLDNTRYQAQFNGVGVGTGCDQIQVIFQQ